MNDQDVHIPPVIEGHPRVRAVWYSHASSEIPPLERGANPALVAQRNLKIIREAKESSNWSGGIPLETDGESDIAQLSWSKDTSSPAGVMSLSLYPRKNYANAIQPGDVLVIYARGDKVEREYLLALISVDTVNETTVASSTGATNRTVQVQGRDLGKVLMETPTVFDSAFGGVTISRFFEEFLKAFSTDIVQGGPSNVVQTMLAIFFSLKQNFVTLSLGQSLPSVPVADIQAVDGLRALSPWQFPGHPITTLFSFLDTRSFVQTPMVGALVANGTLLQSAGNLWSLCSMYANLLVNEFFIDTRDLVPGFDDSIKRSSIFAQRFLQRFGESGGRQSSISQEIDDALAPDLSVISDLNTQTAEAQKATALSFGLESLNTLDFHRQRNRKALDTDDVQSVVALVHRQMPYDTYSFYLLPTSIVYETEVYDSNLSRSAHDVKNIFRIRMPGIVEGIAQDLQFGVTLNRNSVRKYGLRLYEGESIYPYTTVGDREQADKGSVPDYRPTFDYYMSLVTSWHAFNERMWSGSFSLRPRPDIRVGTRLTYVRTIGDKKEIFDFYVQSVQHNFSPQPGASSTTLQVVRGVKREEGMYVGDQPEANLFWTDTGRNLLVDPYEIVVSEDQVAVSDPGSVKPEHLVGRIEQVSSDE